MEQPLIKSPLNYTGGKFKLLPQILPLFPNKIENFFDIFCGGLNVALNTKSKKLFCIDSNQNIIKLYKYFLSTELNEIINTIEKIITHYNLSNSKTMGYDYYQCNSSEGLSSYNKKNFNKLKVDYNNSKYNGFNENALFYVLIIFSFNNQIRFNKKNQFNMPSGKRDFNKNIEKNLINFIKKIQISNIYFEFNDYTSILNNNNLNNENSFVYVDPPYLISTATYNESNGWNEYKEQQLLDFLSKINENNIKFALSNVIEHKTKFNHILLNWFNKNSFNIYYLKNSYNNSSYHGKSKDEISKEVLITNY